MSSPPSAPAFFATVMGIGRGGHTLDGIVQQQAAAWPEDRTNVRN